MRLYPSRESSAVHERSQPKFYSESRRAARTRTTKIRGRESVNDLPRAYKLLEEQCDVMIRQLEACQVVQESTSASSERSHSNEEVRDKIRSLQEEVVYWRNRCDEIEGEEVLLIQAANEDSETIRQLKLDKLHLEAKVAEMERDYGKNKKDHFDTSDTCGIQPSPSAVSAPADGFYLRRHPFPAA